MQHGQASLKRSARTSLIVAIAVVAAIAIIVSMRRPARPMPLAHSFQTTVTQVREAIIPQVPSVSFDAVLPQSGEVVYEGIAERLKVGPLINGSGWVIIAEGEWPLGIDGQIVRAVGRLETRYDLPVFIRDPSHPCLDGMPSGIPMPPGTDLHEASKREVLVVREWAVKPS